MTGRAVLRGDIIDTRWQYYQQEEISSLKIPCLIFDFIISAISYLPLHLLSHVIYIYPSCSREVSNVYIAEMTAAPMAVALAVDKEVVSDIIFGSPHVIT